MGYWLIFFGSVVVTVDETGTERKQINLVQRPDLVLDAYRNIFRGMTHGPAPERIESSITMAVSVMLPAVAILSLRRVSGVLRFPRKDDCERAATLAPQG